MLKTLAKVDVPWEKGRRRVSSEFGSGTPVSKTSSVYLAVSIGHQLVTDVHYAIAHNALRIFIHMRRRAVKNHNYEIASLNWTTYCMAFNAVIFKLISQICQILYANPTLFFTCIEDFRHSDDGFLADYKQM